MHTLRPATLDDVVGIHDVQRSAGQVVQDPVALKVAILDVNRLVVVAVEKESVVGWAKTHHWDYDDGSAPAGHYLGGVTVSPRWRRQGVGTALTDARLEWIWQRALEAWYVTNVRNLASIELHRRRGFEVVARAPQFHTTSFDDGVGTLWRPAPLLNRAPQAVLRSAPTRAICFDLGLLYLRAQIQKTQIEAKSETTTISIEIPGWVLTSGREYPRPP